MIYLNRKIMEEKMKNIGNEYSWQGMLAATIFLLFGIGVFYFTGIFDIRTIQDLKDYLFKYGMTAIFGAFFGGVGIYCWVLYIRNVLIGPRREVLYLLDIDDDNICTFVNKKGKKYYFANKNYSVGKYYQTNKRLDYIENVVGQSSKSFQLAGTKDSYWLNFYSPMGNFENLWLLPIVYVLLAPGGLMLILLEGMQKIYGIIFMALPLFIIIYDLVYKIKKRKTGVKVNENSFLNAYLIFQNSVQLLVAIVFNVIVFYLLTKTTDIIGYIFLVPFSLCALCVLGQTVASLLKKEKIVKLFGKVYIGIFLLFWLAFVGFWTYGALQESLAMALFSIPFWAVGIFGIYKLIKSNKE